MSQRKVVSCMLATTLVTFALTGAGCKKEEPKTEKASSAPAPQSASAPPATGTGMFMAQITASVPQTVKKGSKFELPVTVRNASGEVWQAKGANAVKFSYHWRDAKTYKPAIWDGIRTTLPGDLAPGQEATRTAKIEVPKAPGTYKFELDMVMDTPDGGWFGKKGSTVSSNIVEVK